MLLKKSYPTPLYLLWFCKNLPKSNPRSMALWEVTEPTQECPSILGSPTTVQRCSTAVPNQPEPPLQDTGFQSQQSLALLKLSPHSSYILSHSE